MNTELNNQSASELKHSILGRISLTFSLISIVLLTLFWLTMNQKIDIISDFGVYATMLGVVSIPFSMIVCPIALILAIIGLFQKNCKKLFPILGLVFNSLILIILTVLFFQAISFLF